MNYLLDVNILIAAIWADQAQHQKAFDWLEGKTVTVCSLVEIGFLRISSHPKIVGMSMAAAREQLADFLSQRKARRIPDDLPALEAHADKSETVTDTYLATLAARHGLKLATFDQAITHPAAVHIG